MAIIQSLVPVLSITEQTTGNAENPPTGGTALFQVNTPPFTAPNFPGKAYAITSMFFCNRDTQPALLTIYLVPKGKNPSSTNVCIKELAINVGDTFAFDSEKIILGEQDAIWATADRSSAINAFLSVVQVQ